jgi:hypothetical protein
MILAPAQVSVQTLRATRLAQLVTTMDPVLVAAVFGIRRGTALHAQIVDALMGFNQAWAGNAAVLVVAIAETATAELSIQLGWAPWPHWARVRCPATEAEIAAAIDAAIDAATAELNQLRLTP